MKCLCFLLGLCSLTVAFADPFYGEKPATDSPETMEQAVKNPAHFAKSSSFLTACNPTEKVNSLNLAEEFQDLKLVGLIHIQGQFKGLFKNKENKLMSLAENDFIAAQGIQIKTINLKSLQYIHWGLTEQCDSPHLVTLKL